MKETEDSGQVQGALFGKNRIELPTTELGKMVGESFWV